MPQGSVLGLLFIIFVNTTEKGIDSRVLKFPGDVKVLLAIGSGKKSGGCPVHAGSADLAFPLTDIIQSFSRVRRHQLVIGADAWASSCQWRHTALDDVSSSDSELPLP